MINHQKIKTNSKIENMKNLKLVFLSILFVVCCFTSCTNDEPVIEEQNIEESASITTSLSQLRTQFDNQGDVIPTENPTGNIVFDFCFDFVYPLNLSYNNGTSVTVNSLDDLINVIINSTEELYISGIEFPFDVETYNDDTEAIVVATISNEEEFVMLLESCDFENDFSCECTEEYNPVCVEIEAPDGETFLMTYPNACYAECDGFTEADFAENCEDDYNCPGGNDCFTFNFPITIITDNGETITVGSQEELDTVLYNVYYFDFVYSFDVTFDDGTVLSIGNEEAFLELLETCFGDNNVDDCDCDDNFDPVCVQVEENGSTIVYTFINACHAECEGFTEADFVECEDGNNPADCSEEDISSFLVECVWYINTSLYNNVNAEYVQFYQDGSLEIFSEGSNDGVNGTWDLSSNPTGEVYMFFNITDGPYDVFSQFDWTVTQCSEGFIILESGNEFIQLERDCDDNNNPGDCSEEDVAGLLVECQYWSVIINNQEYEYVFGSDGTVTVSINNDSLASGTWSTSTNGDGDAVVSINTNSDNFNSDWTFLSCSEDNIIISSSANWMSNIESGCP